MERLTGCISKGMQAEQSVATGAFCMAKENISNRKGFSTNVLIVTFLLVFAVIAISVKLSAFNAAVNQFNQPISITPTKAPVQVNNPATTSPAPTDDPCGSGMGTPNYLICKKLNTPKLQITVKENDSSLVVTNNEDVTLTHCDYSIDSDINKDDFYELGVFSDYATIPAHQTVNIPWGDIIKQDGTRFQYAEQAPTDLVIDCTGAKGDEEWSNY